MKPFAWPPCSPASVIWHYNSICAGRIIDDSSIRIPSLWTRFRHVSFAEGNRIVDFTIEPDGAEAFGRGLLGGVA